MASQIMLTAADDHACATDVLIARQPDPRKFRVKYTCPSALVLWRSNSTYAMSTMTAPTHPIASMSKVMAVRSGKR